MSVFEQGLGKLKLFTFRPGIFVSDRERKSQNRKTKNQGLSVRKKQFFKTISCNN